MGSAPDIAALLQDTLSAAQASVITQATALASAGGLPLYLVGGGVRDLLMLRPLKDLDLVVEGDAGLFADALAGALAGRPSLRSQFGTTALKVGGMNVDIVMARKETYAHPGALPTVTPSSIMDDLQRRDFTIHAIAMRLLPSPAALLDPTGGLPDLDARLVRILHSKSFQDDATRILRAVRYEQRLGFRLEPETERLLQRDVTYLNTISGDRLRRELDLAFHEASAPAFLARAASLGVLQALYPALPGGPVMQERLARLPSLGGPPLPLAYLALLAYGLGPSQRQSLAQRLNAPRAWRKVLEDTPRAEENLAALPTTARPSAVWAALQGLAVEALQAAAVMAASAHAQGLALRYLKDWRQVRPALNGNDLLRLGILQGPAIKEALAGLQNALLDGAVKTVHDQEAFVRQWLKTHSHRS
ncbi:MAG: CCA tRNA nucleotidyltransferase [Chloroflexi bacterium]|nr:CCA tRNA nucleotidyltransferase [Chloroflexota bacterium]